MIGRNEERKERQRPNARPKQADKSNIGYKLAIAMGNGEVRSVCGRKCDAITFEQRKRKRERKKREEAKEDH